MGKPQVPIEVNDATGVWSVDGTPMVLVPRHFFVNNHNEIERAVGRERNADIAYAAGHISAYVWCEKEAKVHGLRDVEVFHHYMKRLSQRGWAQFDVQSVDPKTGRARVHVRHSIFVLQHQGPPAKVCYAFCGWFCGALEWVGHQLGEKLRLDAREVACAAEGAECCVFEVGAAE